jgi:DNA invertase Pin-like site-specific DNA recombinase
MRKVQLESPYPTTRRAAQYVRMSTEHQKYSPASQQDAITSYAIPRQIEVIRTYADLGRSGLDVDRRHGLRKLIDDVSHGRHDFTELLVYDVSRWGRFQDVDESAFYEFICKRAGVTIHYCAEQFENDGSLSSMILKTLKRSMAAEYSRELSIKVFSGQSRLVEMGFHQGGRAGYGLRRQLRDQDGNIKCLLRVGERKSIQTDRTVLVHGPDEEVAIVRTIFDLHTVAQVSTRGIVRLLNERGIKTDRGTPWTRTVVSQLLENPKYTGANVYNRTSFKLHVKPVTNPPEMWIRRDNAFAPIVPVETFSKAQEVIRFRTCNQTDEQLLARLRALWNKEGKLSAEIIAKDKGMPEVATYQRRFGSLGQACKLIDHPPLRNDKFYRHRATAIRKMQTELYADIKGRLCARGVQVEDSKRHDQLRINGQVTVRFKYCYCSESSAPRWQVSFKKCPNVDMTVAVRLAPGNTETLDYFLLPHLAEFGRRIQICRDNACVLDAYRFDTLDFFLELWKRKVP